MKENLRIAIFCSLGLILLIGGCGKKMDVKDIDIQAKLAEISDGSIDSLAEKKIFFAHMSVGYDIIDGIRSIQEKKSRFEEIKIIEIDETMNVNRPGIYHKKNGKNGDAKSKFDAFREFLKNEKFTNKFDIAALKLCYIDFMPEIDVDEILNQYTKCVQEVKKSNPSTKILHMTTPLTVHAKGIKGWINIMIKGDIVNYRRAVYNKKLHELYQGTAPIYDIALVESTYPDGSREEYSYKGNMIFSMIEEYTTDGGHLNETGKKLAAAEFLRVLTNMAK